jgi:hypothetical protein
MLILPLYTIHHLNNQFYIRDNNDCQYYKNGKYTFIFRLPPKLIAFNFLNNGDSLKNIDSNNTLVTYNRRYI